MRERTAPSWTRWLLLSAAVVALDLATKAWITATLRYGEAHEVTPFFNLVLVHNKGAAFSFLADAGGWQRWFFTAVTLVISAVLVWMLRRQHANRLLAVALALVLGGAIGNLWDRVTLGHVVDFVQLHAAGYSWPGSSGRTCSPTTPCGSHRSTSSRSSSTSGSGSPGKVRRS